MYTNTCSGRIFQDLRGYLLGAGQGPVFPLECAGFEHCRLAELILSCTPSKLTCTTLSHAPHSPAISFSLYSDASVPLHVLFVCLEFPSTSPALVYLQSSHSSSSLWATSPSCEKPSLMPPGRLSFSLLCPRSSLNTPVIHRSLVSISHTMGNTVNAFRVGNK